MNLIERHQLDLGLRSVAELDLPRLAEVEVHDAQPRSPRRSRRRGPLSRQAHQEEKAHDPPRTRHDPILLQ
jgi:hypothetical protein